MSLNQSVNLTQVRTVLAKSVRDHWIIYLIEGIVLLALGFLAIVVPPLATLGVTIVIGWVLLASGIIGLITTFWARHAPGFWWSLVSALLGVAAGLVLLAWPGAGAVSLTLLLIAFFIVDGVASIMSGVEHRREISAWGWIVASGVVDLLLAAVLFAGLPATAAWALGLLVGIDMIFAGAALAAVAIHAHARHPDATQPSAPRGAS